MKIDRRGLIAGAGLLALFVALVCPAAAQSSKRLVVLSGAPSWVLRAGGVPATVDLNFATGQYYGCTLAACLSITRASQKTNLLPSSASGFSYTTFANNTLAITPGLGLLLEEARTNQLLNSTAPATQTTGSLGTATFTLWVNGSGSATMSAGTGTGCGTGTASQGSPVSFTITVAGTCTVTVSGSLNAFQLEQGAFGTSLIVTAGATATRAADQAVFNSTLASVLTAAVGAAITQTSNLVNASANPAILIRGTINSYWRANGASGVDYWNGSADLAATLGSGTLSASLVKTGMSWNGSGRSIVANNGTVATDAGGPGAVTAAQFGSQGDGYFLRISEFTSRPSDIALKAATQ